MSSAKVSSTAVIALSTSATTREERLAQAQAGRALASPTLCYRSLS